jgi:transcriptional regulator
LVKGHTVYVPKSFQEADPRALHALVQAIGFGLLVTVKDGLPSATHLPMLLDPSRGDRGALFGHLARANPQWRSFDGSSPALAVFLGPHAYVSPRWYREARNVPTWDYVAVHANGSPRLIESRDAVRDLLERTMRFYESAFPEPKSFDSIPPDYVEGLLNRIVAFELPIAHIAGARKLSQNKGAMDRARVAEGLRSTHEPGAARVAALVEETLSEGVAREASA